MTQVTLLLSVLLATLLRTWAQSIDAALTITLSNSIVQQASDYAFSLLFVYNDPFVSGSIVSINFPAEYVSNSTTSYPCQLTNWPFLVTSSVQCSMTNRVLTLSGAFTQQFQVLAESTFEFVVRGIINPTFAGDTSVFYGKVTRPDLTTIVGISQQSITIVPGLLRAQLTVSPAVVSTTADLTITVTTSHPLPGSAKLRLFSPTNTWDRANSISPESIFTSTPSCNAVNNTLSNLYCDFTTSSSQRTITVYNINSLGSQASPSATTFTFKVSSIQTAPTTEAQGSFSLIIQNSGSRPIDWSQNNKIGGLSPKEITSASLLLSTYTVGEPATATIRMSINSIITSDDMLNIEFPSTVSLSTLSRVVVEGTQIPTYSINANILSFSGVQIVTSIPIAVVLSSILNPPYVMQVGTAGSAFRIWTSRGGYKVDEKASPFFYATTPGDINCSSVTPGSTQAGLLTSFALPLTFQHPISAQSSLQIAFPSTSFSIRVGGSADLACSSNLSPSCTLTLLSDNLAKLENVVAANSISEHREAVITLNNIANPTNVDLFTGLQISTYNQNGNLVDKEDNVEGFVVTARQISPSAVSITTTDAIVNSLTEVRLTVLTNNPLTIYSHMMLYIPLQLNTGGLSCTPYCDFDSSSTHNIYKIDISSFYRAGSQSTITVIMSNIRNPKSTRPTQSFQVYLHNSATNALLEFVREGLEYRLCTDPAPLSISLDRNSTTNSHPGVLYTFRLGTSFVYSATEQVVASLALPLELECSSCIRSSVNATQYSTVLSSDSSGSALLLNPAASLSISLKNHHSLQPMPIAITILTADQAYRVASGVVTVTNTLPNGIDISYSFLPASQQYLESTVTLSISSMRVTYGFYGYMELHFGGQFDVSAAVLTTGGGFYELSIISNTVLKLTKRASASNSSTSDILSIGAIKSPSFTPSTGIYLQTFTTSGAYRVDQSTAPIVWQSSCSLPCKQCQTGLPTVCQSCYSDELLVAGRVLFMSNGSSSTCVTVCPPLYYQRASTNSCELCSPACANCLQYSVCTSCPTSLPYILALNSSYSRCYAQCPISYYPSSQTLPLRCLECSISVRHCLTCRDFLSCDSCQPNYFYHASQCLPSCPNLTTVANEYTWVCQPCPANCSTCSRDTILNGSFHVSCQTCLPGYLLDTGGCYPACVTYGLVADTSRGVCTSCSPACLTCSISMFNCTSCSANSSTPYFLSNRCLATCPPGYYNDTHLLLCVACNGPCEYCTSSSVSSCLSCIIGYSLYDTVCRNACPEGYYQNGSQCVACPTQCATCSSASVCLGCADGHSLFAARDCLTGCPDGYASLNRVCLQCSSNCKTCSLVNFCTSCFPNMYLYQGLCTNPCPAKHFADTAMCSSCPFECAECLNLLVCQSCISGYNLTNTVTGTSCRSICPSGQVPLSGVCQPCAVGCLECTYVTGNCTTCTTGYYLYHNVLSTTLATFSNICYLSCPLSVYTYGPMLRCLDACPSASFPNVSYSPANSSVVVSKECIDCPPLCAECTSASTCLSCKTGGSFLNNACYSNCPPAYPFSVSGLCKSCNIVQCYQCASSVCVQCNTNYLLILTDGANMCLGSCGDGMAYNATARKCELIANGTSANTTANLTNGSSSIGFIPLPYCIAGAFATVVVLVLHWAQHVTIFTSLFGLAGGLLTLAVFTCTALLCSTVVAQMTASATTRLLATDIAFGSTVTHRMLLVLLVLCLMMLMINFLSGVVYFCRVRAKRYRIVGILSIVVSCKIIGGLLCSNYYGINMKYSHPFLPKQVVAQRPKSSKSRICTARKDEQAQPATSQKGGQKLSQRAGLKAEQIISQTVKPSRIYSSPGPRAEENCQQEYVEHSYKFVKEKDKISAPPSRSIEPEPAEDVRTVAPNEPQLELAEEEYQYYWSFYDRLILASIPLDLALVVSGVLLCFDVQTYHYQFFGGIEIALLGIIDIILTSLWRVWNHKAHRQGDADSKSGYQMRAQEDESMFSALSKQKLYKPEDGQLLEDLQQKLNQKQPAADEQSLIWSQKLGNEPQSQMRGYSGNVQEQDSRIKDFKSEYARPIDVIRLRNEQIGQAIEEGVYRLNKKSLAQKQRIVDEESKLDSADKFNRVQNQRGLDSHEIECEQQKVEGTAANNLPPPQFNRKAQKGSDKGPKQNEEVEQKADQVVFQMCDEESMATSLQDDQISDQSDYRANKRVDSLGSQKNAKKQVKLYDAQPIVHEAAKIQSRDKNLRTVSRTNKDGQLPGLAVETYASRQFTNIFENELAEEQEGSPHSPRQTGINNKFASEELEVVNLQNVYTNRRKHLESRNLVKRSGAGSNDDKVKKAKVIYADLDSVGTVSEYDVQEPREQHEDRDFFNPRRTYEEFPSKMSMKQDGLEVSGSNFRPSNFINTNFVYKNTTGQGAKGQIPDNSKLQRKAKKQKGPARGTKSFKVNEIADDFGDN